VLSWCDATTTITTTTITTTTKAEAAVATTRRTTTKLEKLIHWGIHCSQIRSSHRGILKGSIFFNTLDEYITAVSTSSRGRVFADASWIILLSLVSFSSCR
jgi:hypothetical protein